MGVRAEEVSVGEYFIAAGDELRRVVRLTANAQGAVQVHYQFKSASVTNKIFLFGHAPTDAPNVADFADQCIRRLSRAEAAELRQRGILLEYD